ncbi:hypothetical protein LguiB_010003 [Lonicera macranthoides]
MVKMSSINWDDFDIGDDVRYERQSKRKAIDTRASESSSWIHNLKGALQNGGLGDGQIDADYKIFLTYLHNEFEASDEPGDNNNTRESEEVISDGIIDDADPQYKAFLGRLRKYGKAYALEVPKDNGGCKLIVYEAPEVERFPQTKRKLRNFKKIFRNGEKIDARKHLRRDVQTKDKIEHPTVLGEKKKIITNGEKIDAIKHLRRNVQTKDKNEQPTVLGEKEKIITNGEKIDARKHLTRNVQTKDMIEQPKVSGKVLGEKGKSLNEKQSRAECVTAVSNGVKECSSQKPSQEDTYMHENAETNDRDDTVIDNCYQYFLNRIETEGDCVVYVGDGGKRIKYEEHDSGSSSDMEMWANDNVPDSDKGEATPSIIPKVFESPMEGDDLRCLGSRNHHSQFRENLMNILKRPYDQDEFDDLLQEVNVQKKMEVDRDLRDGRTRTVSADKFSKSYLDHHSDLRRVLNSVRFERPKMLNILRGFFYWLQNLTQDGVFIPWLDPSCLAVMPGSR